MKFVLLFFLCCFQLSVISQTDSLSKQQFIDLEMQWMNAWKNKDEATIRKLISDDFTLTSSLSTGERQPSTDLFLLPPFASLLSLSSNISLTEDPLLRSTKVCRLSNYTDL
jgi:hypothetical protein